jgi:transcriptional regulator with XRE-family HTH domain
MADKRKSEVWLAFRAALSKALLRSGLKQYELAQRVGVNPSSIVGWLKEGSIPRGETLLRLAKVLALDPGDLVHTSARAAPQTGEDASAYLTAGAPAENKGIVNRASPA